MLTPQVASSVSKGLPYRRLIIKRSKRIPTIPLTTKATIKDTITYELYKELNAGILNIIWVKTNLVKQNTIVR